MDNEERAEALAKRLGFVFETISKAEIIRLLKAEIADFQEGSAEYIRLLCGYLFCLGDASDIPLLKQAKYSINMDVGCMVDLEWIQSLENGGKEDALTRSREELIEDFTAYYG